MSGTRYVTDAEAEDQLDAIESGYHESNPLSGESVKRHIATRAALLEAYCREVCEGEDGIEGHEHIGLCAEVRGKR